MRSSPQLATAGGVGDEAEAGPSTSAVLYFAVSATVNGLDIPMVGLIFMVVGFFGLVLSLVRGTMTSWTSSKTRRTASPDGRTVVEESHII